MTLHVRYECILYNLLSWRRADMRTFSKHNYYTSTIAISKVLA